MRSHGALSTARGSHSALVLEGGLACKPCSFPCCYISPSFFLSRVSVLLRPTCYLQTVLSCPFLQDSNREVPSLGLNQHYSILCLHLALATVPARQLPLREHRQQRKNHHRREEAVEIGRLARVNILQVNLRHIKVATVDPASAIKWSSGVSHARTLQQTLQYVATIAGVKQTRCKWHLAPRRDACWAG